MAYAHYNSVDHTACCHTHTCVLKCMPVVRPCQLLLQSIFLLTEKVDIILQRGVHSAQHMAHWTLHCTAHCSQAQLRAMQERKHWLPATKLTSSKPRFLVGNFASPVQSLPWAKICTHTSSYYAGQFNNELRWTVTHYLSLCIHKQDLSRTHSCTVKQALAHTSPTEYSQGLSTDESFLYINKAKSCNDETH